MLYPPLTQARQADDAIPIKKIQAATTKAQPGLISPQAVM